MYKIEYPPPPGVGIKLAGKENQVGKKGRGRKRERKKGIGKGKRKGKWKRREKGSEEKGREKGRGKGKGREGLIFFPRERLDFGEENQLGKKEREKGGKA